jgi:hypothetical protein
LTGRLVVSQSSRTLVPGVKTARMSVSEMVIGEAEHPAMIIHDIAVSTTGAVWCLMRISWRGDALGGFKRGLYGRRGAFIPI